MKYVIILLLSVNGVEEIKLKGSNCEVMAESWREINTTYYEGPNQGNYTRDGKLMFGYICQ
jgi:hypothetical protein